MNAGITAWAVGVAMAASPALAGPFGDGFEKGEAADYLAPAPDPKAAVVTNADGRPGRVLLLVKPGTYKMKPVPAQPGMKYKATLSARVDGPDVIERNTRLDIMQVAAPQLLVRWQVTFLDATNKPVAARSFGMAFVSSAWRPYTDVFHAPTNAAAMAIDFILPDMKNRLLVDDVTLEPCPDEGALNCNPDFRYGSMNYSGWASVNTGGLLISLWDQRFGLDTAYGSSGEKFPLAGRGTYRLSARGNVRGGFRTVLLRLYDANGEVLKTRDLVATPTGASVDFVIPPEAVAGSFLVYNHILEEVRLVRMGDESKLAELDAERKASTGGK